MMKFVVFLLTLLGLSTSTVSAASIAKGYLPAVQNIYVLFSGVLVKGPV